MTLRAPLAALALVLISAAPRPIRQSRADAGITVDFSVGSPAREDDQVEVSFAIHDANGAPLAGVGPKAWFGVPDQRPCKEKVATFTAGGLFHQPALDLNIFHVIALNDDGTITVVDPHFSFGGTRLLAMTQLAGRGEDWALDDKRGRLFVAIPTAGEVTVIDTATWKIVRSIAAGTNVARLLLQNDGGYVWAAYDAGVVAIDAEALTIAGRIQTGRGPHDLALTPNDAHLFVTNAGDGSTSLIDVRALKNVGRYSTGANPHSVAYASRSARAYVVSDDGTVFSVDPKQRRARKIADMPKGISRIRFAPAGRFGFMPNPETDVVYVIDTAIDRVVQTAHVDKRPFEVTFSDTTAYVRHEASETVMMIPLALAGTPGQPISVSDFPGGERPFGPNGSVRADGIVRAPGEHAVLIANPGDGNIYYYREGMAAPMGYFANYRHAPRAVLVLDRSLRETTPGVFRTVAKLPAAGTYDVAVVVDSPRVVTCFQLAVAANPNQEKRRKTYPVIVQQLTPKRLVCAGETMRLRFRLLDPETRKPRHDLSDVTALIFRAPGEWSERVALQGDENGDYTTEFVSPDEGTYYVYIESAKAGLRLNNHQYLVFRVKG